MSTCQGWKPDAHNVEHQHHCTKDVTHGGPHRCACGETWHNEYVTRYES